MRRTLPVLEKIRSLCFRSNERVFSSLIFSPLFHSIEIVAEFPDPYMTGVPQKVNPSSPSPRVITSPFTFQSFSIQGPFLSDCSEISILFFLLQTIHSIQFHPKLSSIAYGPVKMNISILIFFHNFPASAADFIQKKTDRPRSPRDRLFFSEKPPRYILFR